MSSITIFLLTSILFYLQPKIVNDVESGNAQTKIKGIRRDNYTATNALRGQPKVPDPQNLRNNSIATSFPPPKVVILPGPHKTGSTSLQTCLVDWTWNDLSKMKRQRKENPVRTPLSLPDWAWAVPDNDELIDAQLLHTNPIKAFASYLGIVDRDPAAALSPQGRIDTGRIIADEKVQNVTELFQSSMQRAWDDGYNIVFGTEGMDRLVRPMNTNSSIVMSAIMNILPQKSPASTRKLTKQDVEVVVIHRRPRIKHLISVWHQEQRPDESLRSYLENRLLPHARYLDALGVAQKFLQKGIRTTIIDVTGVRDELGNQTNICHVVACDVLGTSNCTKDRHQLSNLASFPGQDISLRPRNQRSNRGSMDVTDEQLDSIEKILMEYDCGFRDAFRRFNEGSMLRYLYNNNIFAGCDSLKNTSDFQFHQRSLEWVADHIRNVVRS